MTEKDLSAFLSLYGIDGLRNFYELPRTTSGNVSYSVSTKNGDFVVRTLIRQSSTGAEDEAIIQNKLLRTDIVVPQYLHSLKGDIVCRLINEKAVISYKIIGSRQSDDTIELADSMGATLAKIHNTLHDVSIRSNPQQWFDIVNARQQLSVYSGSDKGFISHETETLESIFHRDLPLALTHGDFHTNNIFSYQDKVTAVFDFESAQHTVRILDLARLYLTYRKVTLLDPPAILRTVLSGYDSLANQPLTEQERESFNDICIYVALVSCVSIHNHGSTNSSEAYLSIAKKLFAEPLQLKY